MSDKSQEIINSIRSVTQFYEDFDQESLRYDPESGFVTTESQLAANGITRYLGYAKVVGHDGQVNTDKLIVPITELSDLHPSQQTIDLQGKGVGPRLYNWPGAVLRKPYEIGAYVFDIADSKILDFEPEQGGRARQFSSHLKRIITSEVGNLEDTVAAIHEKYGDASVVRLAQPVKPAITQKLKGQSNPDSMPAAFMLVRDSSNTLRRVGDYKPGGQTLLNPTLSLAL